MLPGDQESRNITPAFDQLLTSVSEVTRAMSVWSPLAGCEAKLNSSAAFQMSPPPPVTV